MSHFSQEETLSKHDVTLFPKRTSGLFGVRNLSVNRLGQVFWEGMCIRALADSDQRDQYTKVQELGLLCRHLEYLDIPVNAQTTGSHATWFASMQYADPYKSLLSRCPDIYLGSGKIMMCFSRAIGECNDGVWQYYLLGSRYWKKRWQFTDLSKNGYNDTSLASSSLDDVHKALYHYNVPFKLLDVMSPLIQAGEAV